MSNIGKIGTIERYLRRNGVAFNFPIDNRVVMNRSGNGVWSVSDCASYIGFYDAKRLPFLPHLIHSNLLIEKLAEGAVLKYRRKNKNFTLKFDGLEDAINNDVVNINIGNGKVLEDLREFDYTGEDYLVESLENLFEKAISGQRIFMYRTFADFTNIAEIRDSGYMITFSNKQPSEENYKRISDLPLVKDN